MKKVLIILIIIELAIALFIGFTGHIDRSEQVSAFVKWYNNKTIENKILLDHQISITNMYRLGISSLSFIFMIFITILVLKIKSIKKK